MSIAVRIRNIERPTEVVRFVGYDGFRCGRFAAHWPDGEVTIEKCSEWEPIDGHSRIAEWPEAIRG